MRDVPIVALKVNADAAAAWAAVIGRVTRDLGAIGADVYFVRPLPRFRPTKLDPVPVQVSARG